MASPDAQVILRFASGIPVLILGIVLLSVRPRRANQLAFAAFAILWGLQTTTANFGALFVDASLHRTFLLLSFAFSNVAPLFLVHFASQLGLRRWRWVPTSVYIGIAIAGLAAIVFAPQTIVESVRTVDGRLSTRYGVLATPLFFIPFYVSFVYALTILYLAMRRAKPGTLRHRMRGMLIALAVYCSYSFPFFALSYLDLTGGISTFATGFVTMANDTSFLMGGLFFLAAAAYLLGLAVHAAARPPPPEGRDIPLLLAFAVPASIAVLETVLKGYGVPMETSGFWRFLMVGVLVYTLANYQLFELELKMKRFAAPAVAGLLLIFGVPIALSMSLGDFGFEALLFVILPECVGTAGVLVFHQRVSDALFPGVRDEPDYHHQRRLELYKVALEDALARGRGPDHPSLKDVRLRFGVSQEEHNLLVMLSGFAAPRGAAPHEAEFAKGARVLDRYRVERILGRGTSRVTYLATDLKTHRLVAIKAVRTSALDGSAARLLVRDARLAASIAHPNVLAIFDVAEMDDTAFIVMDFADKGNLQDRLLKQGVMPIPEAVRFLSELLGALDAIHDHGIVHGNLKPKNVLIDNDGSVLLADFSAAHVGDGRLGAERGVDDAIRALLDVLYLSPEQLRGEAPVPQSDLYVAAVLFHQAISNRFYLPIQGKDDSEIRDLILYGRPTLQVGAAPEWVVRFLRRALAKDPAERHPDAASMLEDLRAEAGLVVPGRWPRAPDAERAAV